MNRSFWRLYRNKILACSFAGFGLALYIGSIAFNIVAFGWEIYATSPLTIISALLTLFVYTALFVTNLQNDNRAYNAITWFLFFVIFDMIYAFLPGGFNVYTAFGAPFPWLMFAILMLLAVIATGTLGVFTYLYLFRYRIGRIFFERLFLFALLFAVSLTIYSVFACLLLSYLLSFSSVGMLYALFSFLPDVFIVIAVVFTLKRLRR